MSSVKNSSRLLGIAFLLQFITSFSSGSFIQPALTVPGDIGATMIKIAENPTLMRGYILVDMVTAMGIVFLGVMLFMTLRKQNETVALVALGLYILEAALLAVSRLSTFSLLRMSEHYVSAGEPALLLTMGSAALDAMEFVGLTLHVLVFSVGAFLFYALLYQSRAIPRVLSLWGLITLIPLFLAIVGIIFGYEGPAILYLPYFPFEFVVGLWILVKGLRAPQGEGLVLEPA